MADGAPGAAELPTNTADLTVFVQNLLTQMQTRFQTMSDGIIGKSARSTNAAPAPAPAPHTPAHAARAAGRRTARPA